MLQFWNGRNVIVKPNYLVVGEVNLALYDLLFISNFFAVEIPWDPVVP